MERFINGALWTTFIGSVLLMIVPAILVYTMNINYYLFVGLNTAGLLLATFFIIFAAGVRLAIARLGAGMTDFAIRNTRMSKIIFVFVIVAQLLNLMFINGV